MTNQQPADTTATPQSWKDTKVGKIVSYVILATVFIIVVSKIITWNDLPGCDSSDTKGVLSNIFKDKDINPKRYIEITTTSKAKELIQCNASLAMEDETILVLDYQVTRSDKGILVKITSASEKPKS